MAYRSAGNEVVVPPELWRATAAAFALVACADGELATDERTRFERWLAEQAQPSELHRETMALFDALARRLLGVEAEPARSDAAALVRACANTEQHELVLAAARSAIVADQRIDEREELMLRQICEWLGLDPERG
jgi:tellurite resistance protein